MTNTTGNLRAVSFLKYLYSELIQDFKTMNLTNVAKQYDIPDVIVFCWCMVDKQILLRKRNGQQFQYKWNDQHNPGPELVAKIKEYMQDYHKKDKAYQAPKKPFNPPSPMGKNIEKVIKEQAIMEIPVSDKVANANDKPSVSFTDLSETDAAPFSEFIKAMKKQGITGTINITLNIQ